MNERIRERLGASAGIVFFVLFLMIILVGTRPPETNASASTISAHFSDNYWGLVLAMVLNAVSGMVFLWFAGHLQHVLKRAEGGAETFAPLVFGSGVAFAVVVTLESVPSATLAMLSRQPEAANNAALTHALIDIDTVLGGIVGILAASFLAAAGLAMIRGDLARAWLGWLGMLVALTTLVGGIAQFYAASAPGLASGLSIPGTIGLFLWVLITAGVMLYRPEVDRTASALGADNAGDL